VEWGVLSDGPLRDNGRSVANIQAFNIWLATCGLADLVALADSQVQWEASGTVGVNILARSGI